MKKELIAHRNPKSPNSEIFRTLRTNIQFMNTNKKLKTLLVTSTFPGEGKSWVSSNLAVTFAQAGKKVIVIDADMRKGRLYTIFGVSPKPGLSNYLAETEINENGENTKNIGDYIQETDVENLYVISAGNVPPNPSELLVSPQMIKSLDDLKEMCDLIIIDGTPCELVADSIILSRIVDSCIIITAHNMTKKEALERVIKNIRNVGGKLAGVVINRVPTSKGKYGSRYYYYGSKKTIEQDKTTFKKVNKNDKQEINNILEENITKLHEEMQEKIQTIENNENFKTNEQKDITEGSINEQNNITEGPINEQPITDIKENEVNNIKETENNNPEIINETEQKDESNKTEEKTHEILQQINDYINNENNNL